MTDSHVLEIAEFSLVEGTTPEAFRVALAATDRFIAAQPGFVDRRTARLVDGRWIDVVEWRTKANAEAAAAEFMSGRHPELSDFIAALDMATASMRHAAIAGTGPA